jgi:hypothetical protein
LLAQRAKHYSDRFKDFTIDDLCPIVAKAMAAAIHALTGGYHVLRTGRCTGCEVVSAR